jgi:hypothetical protein
MTEPSWSFESNESDRVAMRMHFSGKQSLDELIQWIYQHAPGVDDTEVFISGGMVSWSRDATEEELAKRDEWRREREKKLERWERDTFARLQEKYREVPG